MTLLLFVSLGGYVLASRIGQPAVVGLILVGLAIGSSALGLITYTDFVASMAHLGAIILLFVVGQEFELEDLASLKYAAIGALGVLVPLAAGYWLCLAFGYGHRSSLFVAVALTATSIAITADILREMGHLQTPAAKAIIGAAVVDDVLALLALGVVRQMAQGEVALGKNALIFLSSALFLVVRAWLSMKVLAPLVARLDCSPMSRKYSEVPFIFAMMLAFLSTPWPPRWWGCRPSWAPSWPAWRSRGCARAAARTTARAPSTCGPSSPRSSSSPWGCWWTSRP